MYESFLSIANSWDFYKRADGPTFRADAIRLIHDSHHNIIEKNVRLESNFNFNFAIFYYVLGF